MTPVNDNQPGFYLKLAALLSIVRWKSVLLTALAQYLAFLFAFNTKQDFWHSLGELKVHLIILSTALVVAGGYIINNFYDEERDFINRPHKTRFQHLVSKGFTLNLYLFLNFLALTIALYASWRIFIFFWFFGTALWLYSHKLSKMVFIGEFTAGILSVTAFFSLVLYFKTLTLTIFLYGFSLFLLLFSRELYKAIKSLKGDIVVGYKSIATTIGVIASMRIFQGLLLMSLLPDIALVLIEANQMLYVVLTLIALGKLMLIMIVGRDIVQNKKRVHHILHFLILLYIAGIVWL